MGDFKLPAIEYISMNGSQSFQVLFLSFLWAMQSLFWYSYGFWLDLILLPIPTDRCTECISKEDIIIEINAMTLKRISMMSSALVYLYATITMLM